MIVQLKIIFHYIFILISLSLFSYAGCGEGMEGLFDKSNISPEIWSDSLGITINSSQVADDLANFPVLISFSSNASLMANASPDGFDILFTDDSGNKLDHEIEKYDCSNGMLVAWVRIPFLSCSVDTDIFLYYGNPFSADQSNKTGVWNGNYLLVLHMNNDPSGTAPQIKDSTSNDNSFTNNTGLASDDLVDAKIDQGITFNDNYIEMAGIPGTPSDITLSAWVNYTGTDDGEVISIDDNAGLRLDDTPHNGVHFFYRRISGFQWNSVESNQYITGTGWHYIAASMDDTANIQKIYIDGTVEGSCAYTESIVYHLTSITKIGAHSDNSDHNYHGIIDEVRVSNIARSQAWVETEFNNQNSPDTFYSVW